MTGVSKGRTIALSTPFGQRGWLWKEWQNERADYTLAESRLYRYPSASERGAVGENPVDQDNHAMAALRYCITRLDELPSTLADYDFPVTDFLLEAVLPLRDFLSRIALRRLLHQLNSPRIIPTCPP